MTHLMRVSVAVVMGSAMLFANAEMIKKYEIKSGTIEYEIKGSGNIMGMVETKTSGTKRVVFDNYGSKEFVEEHKVTNETAMGNTKVEKVHDITYMNEGMLYRVDFKRKVIVRMENPAKHMMKMMEGKSVKQAGEEMMKSMGGKKVGSDTVLGYTCDTWEFMGTKQCIHKGVPLKVESNVLGMKSVEIAIKIAFDVKVNKDDFTLPDFPFADISGEKLAIDRHNLDSLDKKQNEQTAKDAASGMEAMIAAMGALAKSGLDMNNPQMEISKEQEDVMKSAMMNAMGGETSMLERAKNEILDDAKIIPQARECFTKATTAKEANACEGKLDSEYPEHHVQWNDDIKSSLLKEMSTFENALPCIKNATSLKALEVCMPIN